MLAHDCHGVCRFVFNGAASLVGDIYTLPCEFCIITYASVACFHLCGDDFCFFPHFDKTTAFYPLSMIAQ